LVLASGGIDVFPRAKSLRQRSLLPLISTRIAKKRLVSVRFRPTGLRTG
jgi:hypothetical protein